MNDTDRIEIKDQYELPLKPEGKTGRSWIVTLLVSVFGAGSGMKGAHEFLIMPNVREESRAIAREVVEAHILAGPHAGAVARTELDLILRELDQQRDDIRELQRR